MNIPTSPLSDLITPFSFPTLRTKAQFLRHSVHVRHCHRSHRVLAVITDYAKGIKYPLADFNITPDVAIVDPDAGREDAPEADRPHRHGRHDTRD